MRLRIAFVIVACAACSKDEPAAEDLNDTPRLGTPDGGRFNTASDGGGVFVECEEETKDIFILSDQNLLYSFHPPTLEFKLKGTLKCPTGGATPTSMAVDRQGVAWVRHSDASLWKVDTRNLECTDTALPLKAESEPFYKFGMGFATASKGGSNDLLFLSDNKGAGLARLDTKTLKVTFVGPYNGALEGKPAELTGTGDGKLFGFFTTLPAQIAEISKGTGEIVNAKELPGVIAGSAYAFSFYGGDFYIYTAAAATPGGPPLAGGGSDVTRFRPSDSSIEVVKKNTGFRIVGAGVSTCAPTEGPK